MRLFLILHPELTRTEYPLWCRFKRFEKHLNWLASTGHVVAFSNGVFSKVEKFPKYGPQWKKRRKRPEAAKAQEVKNDETADQLA